MKKSSHYTTSLPSRRLSIKMLTIFWFCLLILFPIPSPAAVITVPGDFSTIQAAIDASFDGDEIIVSPATYVENIDFGGKNIILRSTDPTNPSVVASTIIDASSSGSVVTFSGAELTTCVLSGLTITNGYALNGGGVYGNGSLATIQNNNITANTAYSPPFGGGGGGLFDCDGTIQNNTVSNNSVTGDISLGGGLFLCDGTIQNNTIYGNSATGTYPTGGGLSHCHGIIQNNTISANSAGSGGGLVVCDGTIQNNTIYGNSANLRGGGLYYSNGIIRNCIIWQNTAPLGAQLDDCTTPSYSCIQGWTGGGTGNISDNLQLVDPANGDFHLQPISPCIDAGCYVPDLTADFEGDPRGYDGTPEPRGDGSDFDIGADEYVPTQTAISPKIWSLYK